ncbi:MAG TPA: LUD domain-containing protein [Actinomycetes bacterium]|nr:LUD domain-containing protein [Actinomycetes bacterium]
MSPRDEILGRVRAALATAAEPAPVSWEYGRSTIRNDVIDLFAERVADYRAVVHRCFADRAGDVVASVFGPDSRVVVPDGFPDAAIPPGLHVVRDDPDNPLSAIDLDRVDGVLTTSACGIAVTGTVVLDHGPGQGRRAVSLVPDRHVCIVDADQVVDDVPAAVARLDPRRAQTWISGPSATSDIELSRVEGVHGPRELHVVLVETSPGQSGVGAG